MEAVNIYKKTAYQKQFSTKSLELQVISELFKIISLDIFLIETSELTRFSAFLIESFNAFPSGNCSKML